MQFSVQHARNQVFIGAHNQRTDVFEVNHPSILCKHMCKINLCAKSMCETYVPTSAVRESVKKAFSLSGS